MAPVSMYIGASILTWWWRVYQNLGWGPIIIESSYPLSALKVIVDLI